MSEIVFGIVINLNVYGAAVRLESGELANAPVEDVEAHRAAYHASFSRRKSLSFELRRQGRRCMVVLAPQIHDERLEEQIAGYLKSTQEWDSSDGPPAHERHFLRKKRRAATFE